MKLPFEMHPKDLRIEDYTYELPDEKIARYPLPVRDSSKLLVYHKGEISEDIYHNIADHVPTGALMVFNQTKVIHARLLFRKPSGGAIEVFCLAPAGHTDIQMAMQQKGSARWECFVGGASKWKEGMTLELVNETPQFTLCAKIAERLATSYIIALEWNNDQLNFAEVLLHAGKMPLPPYLNRNAEPRDETAYQTVYASREGSVAAPTAGLHFTSNVLHALEAKNVATTFVTLHVGAGTFLPVKSSTIAGHDMHAEWMEVSRETIELLLAKMGKKIVAVGTTSMRTLESLYWIGVKLLEQEQVDWDGIAVDQWEPYDRLRNHPTADALDAVLAYMTTNGRANITTRTRILIAPGYDFRIVSGLVTNFHQPQSTLLLLVAALIGDDWHRVYDYALGHDFRFLSYGDGGLLWKREQ